MVVPLAPPLIALVLALRRDGLQALTTDAGLVVNQVGFQFASLTIGSEDGSDSHIQGSRARLASIASVLAQMPEARLLIEGNNTLRAMKP